MWTVSRQQDDQISTTNSYDASELQNTELDELVYPPAAGEIWLSTLKRKKTQPKKPKVIHKFTSRNSSPTRRLIHATISSSRYMSTKFPTGLKSLTPREKYSTNKRLKKVHQPVSRNQEYHESDSSDDERVEQDVPIGLAALGLTPQKFYKRMSKYQKQEGELKLLKPEYTRPGDLVSLKETKKMYQMKTLGQRLKQRLLMDDEFDSQTQEESKQKHIKKPQHLEIIPPPPENAYSRFENQTNPLRRIEPDEYSLAANIAQAKINKFIAQNPRLRFKAKLNRKLEFAYVPESMREPNVDEEPDPILLVKSPVWSPTEEEKKKMEEEAQVLHQKDVNAPPDMIHVVAKMFANPDQAESISKAALEEKMRKIELEEAERKKQQEENHLKEVKRVLAEMERYRQESDDDE